jgi:phytoene dehydrogenase-like protein
LFRSAPTDIAALHVGPDHTFFTRCSCSLARALTLHFSPLAHIRAATARVVVSRFSPADADAWPKFEATLRRYARILDGLVDGPPPDPAAPSRWKAHHGDMARTSSSSFHAALARGGELARHAASLGTAAARVAALGSDIGPFVELLTAPASTVLDRWFESDVLKATLATDAVIGAMSSPHTPGSGCVTL